MRNAGYGRNIHIRSTSVKTPLRTLGVSNTIRCAMAAWSKTLATEIAGWDITGTSIQADGGKTPVM